MKKTFKNNNTIIRFDQKAFKEAFKSLSRTLIEQFSVPCNQESNAWLQGTPVFIKEGNH